MLGPQKYGIRQHAPKDLGEIATLVARELSGTADRQFVEVCSMTLCQ
jgi:hypothetical protein